MIARLGLQFALRNDFIVTELAPLLVGDIHILGKATVIALQCVDKDILPLSNVAQTLKHGIVFSGQTLDFIDPFAILNEVIGEGVTGKFSGKAQLSYLPYRYPFSAT